MKWLWRGLGDGADDSREDPGIPVDSKEWRPLASPCGGDPRAIGDNLVAGVQESDLCFIR